jgi:glyoxylase-like metal-dependent hydrolase (beta-lactamase superfamily II)
VHRRIVARKGKRLMVRLLLAILCVAALGSPASAQTPEYSIDAIRYGTSPNVQLSDLVVGAPQGQRVDIAMVFWLIRGGGRTILFDSGFHRTNHLKEFPMKDYLQPDEALRSAGVVPGAVTDIVISHAHWDHIGGIDLFPKATVWIQRDEYRYYTMDAWQPGGNRGGIDAEDVENLLRLNTEGRVHLIDGDNVEIFPGIRAYTGSRHTYASEYLCVQGHPTFVLASDNAYFYLNLEQRLASATFSDADHAANIAQQARMIQLAGSTDRVVPGHDMLQFKRFPTKDRVAKIK